MKSLIITVAGEASRFNRDLEIPTLKCLYYRDTYRNSLLFQIIEKAIDVDEIIVVGGYLFDDLGRFLEQNSFPEKQRIKLIYNPHYFSKGSGWSLYLGLKEVSEESEEIIFVEGDLYFDSKDFLKIKTSTKNVFTINKVPIEASKAVVIYEDLKNRIKYLYDTSHKYLEIKEPFKAVYNSGQIWKFLDCKIVKNLLGTMDESTLSKTNLEIIQSYFDNIEPSNIERVEMNTWINCNTVNDYNNAYKIINGKSE